jgi:hypothetical protein
VLAAVAWGTGYALALSALRMVDVGGGGLPAVTRMETMTGFGEWAGTVITSLYSTVFVGLGITFLLLLLRVGLQKQSVASAVMVGLVTFTTAAQSSNLVLAIVAGVVVAMGMVIMLTRFGLLQMCVGVLVVGLLESFPPVVVTGEWYFPYSMLTLGVVGGMAAYGAKRSLG